ncbi:MAG: hypothetical protein CFE43_06075 [Burkholderiales bacterium PBB3]|nr:MAG: hypothetical protein CFE43_06075 [Burkholderiales bacterium PBB3]
MSLLLDALQRASKDKEKAAQAAANAAAADSLSEGKFVLAAPAVPASDFPDLVPSAPVATSPVAEVPMALTPESPVVAEKPMVLELEMELETSAPPAAVAPAPVKPVDAPPAITKAPAKDAIEISTNSVATAAVVASTKRPDSAFNTPKSPNPQAAAAAIQNAYAAPVFETRRPPNRRAMVLAGIAGALGLAFASFLFGVWGDPEKLLGLSSVSSVAPAAPATAVQQAPAPAPSPVAVAPELVAATAQVPIPVPAPGVGGVVPLPQAAASAAVPMPLPTAAMAPTAATPPKKPPNPPATEPVLRATPTTPVFAARARSQSALEVGYAALQAGRFDDASRAYAAALEANSSEPDALLGLAYIAHTKGQRDEAQSYYRRVLRHDPGNSVANAGLVALESGSSGAANGVSQGERAKELAARQPESAAVQALAASALVQEGALPDAALAFARAQALEPANPLHAYNLAVALDKLGNYAQAATQYEKALRVSAAASVPLGAPQASAARVRAAQLRQSLGLPQETTP